MGKTTKEEALRKYKPILAKIVAGERKGKVLRDSNYSENVANNPSRVIGKPTFQELLDEYIPSDFTLEHHRKLYNEHRNIKQLRIDTVDEEQINKACEGLGNVQALINKEEGYTTLIINEIDIEAQAKAIDMAYKLRGAYSPTKVEVKRTYEDLTDKEILELMKG